jgi:hypothetical protein
MSDVLQTVKKDDPSRYTEKLTDQMTNLKNQSKDSLSSIATQSKDSLLSIATQLQNNMHSEFEGLKEYRSVQGMLDGFNTQIQERMTQEQKNVQNTHERHKQEMKEVGERLVRQTEDARLEQYAADVKQQLQQMAHQAQADKLVHQRNWEVHARGQMQQSPVVQTLPEATYLTPSRSNRKGHSANSSYHSAGGYARGQESPFHTYEEFSDAPFPNKNLSATFNNDKDDQGRRSSTRTSSSSSQRRHDHDIEQSPPRTARSSSLRSPPRTSRSERRHDHDIEQSPPRTSSLRSPPRTSRSASRRRDAIESSPTRTS